MNTRRFILAAVALISVADVITIAQTISPPEFKPLPKFQSAAPTTPSPPHVVNHNRPAEGFTPLPRIEPGEPPTERSTAAIAKLRTADQQLWQAMTNSVFQAQFQQTLTLIKLANQQPGIRAKVEAARKEVQDYLRQHSAKLMPVFEKMNAPTLLPLIGANLTWINSKSGAVTDMNGAFEIPFTKKKEFLIVSYVGYSPDTVLIEKPGHINITISAPNLLDAIEITHKKRSTEISYLETVKVHQISSKELLKAACCNLAESFDTTPAIDASATDAVTATRKIEMLGLARPYVQITRENMPNVRGLAAVQGLAYTPGPWIEGMQLNMGAGSVVNGFESITGQINVELRKPCHSDQMYLNAYVSQAARLEMNTFSKHTINDKWSTANILHASTRNLRRDHNHDNFMDMPLGKQFGFVNRWKWTNSEGQEGQIGIKLTFTENVSGVMGFEPARSLRNRTWGADMTTNRAEFWAKRGFVNLDKPYKTLGFQVSGVYHDQKSQFGLRRYDASQKSLYFNMIYQSIIDNTEHEVRMGSSFQYDNLHEDVVSTHYTRNEYVPGIFGEYTYKGSEKFSVLLGGRADYHNNFGLFFTPRFNARHAPNQGTVIRLAAGRGQKTASIFAENIGIFASNREIIVEGSGNNDTPRSRSAGHGSSSRRLAA